MGRTGEFVKLKDARLLIAPLLEPLVREAQKVYDAWEIPGVTFRPTDVTVVELPEFPERDE